MDVRAWLEGHDLGQYAEVFASNDIDAEVLLHLTADDLKELGIASLGHRKKLLAAIAGLDGPAPKREPAVSAAPPQVYTPRHLAERILDARALLTGERKHVTVLFADIKGSLEIIEGTDPEEASRILDGAIRVMMDAVHRYEGTVNKVLGDGIMALFGAPIAHEDHAVRACYAALAIQRAMQRPGRRDARHPRHRDQRRIGLHSGEVVVRAIGNDLSMDYDAIGPTVHLASRMEQLASPGTVRLTAATANLAEGFVDLRALGRVPVKGLSQPIDAFDLLGVGCGAHAPAGIGRPRPDALRRPPGRTGGARSGARAGGSRAGPDGRPGWRSGRGQVAAILRDHAQRADAAVAGAGRHLGLVGQGELLGTGDRFAQDLLRYCARRRSATPRRKGRLARSCCWTKRCGRSCQRCSPCSTCRSRTPPGRRSIRPSGDDAPWTA